MLDRPPSGETVAGTLGIHRFCTKTAISPGLSNIPNGTCFSPASTGLGPSVCLNSLLRTFLTWAPVWIVPPSAHRWWNHCRNSKSGPGKKLSTGSQPWCFLGFSINKDFSRFRARGVPREWCRWPKLLILMYYHKTEAYREILSPNMLRKIFVTTKTKETPL